MRSDRKVKGVIVALKFIAPWKSNYPRNLSLSVDKGCKDLFSKKKPCGSATARLGASKIILGGGYRCVVFVV